MKIKPNSVIHLESGENLPGYTNLRPVPKKYIDELKKLMDRMNQQPGTLPLKLKQLYAFLNRFNKEFVSTFTTCKKGCSACCKMDVQLTPFEAEYIALASSIRHRNASLSIGHESPCSFLSEKGTCSIYNYRPLLCRTYHVLSEPELCHDLDVQVIQYGAQRANMSNIIYQTAAQWIYFQTYNIFGSIEVRDIRDFFPYARNDIQQFFKNNPPHAPI